MTKKRLQKKVKKQEQEIYRLKDVIKRTIKLCYTFARSERFFDDTIAKYTFAKLAVKLEERLGEG